jgi:hypothetical protein
LFLRGIGIGLEWLSPWWAAEDYRFFCRVVVRKK